MYPLPTLYKARHLSTKRPVCAICLDRTQGRTQEVRLAYRVSVWLCPGHADPAFQRKRDRIWVKRAKRLSRQIK